MKPLNEMNNTQTRRSEIDCVGQHEYFINHPDGMYATFRYKNDTLNKIIIIYRKHSGICAFGSDTNIRTRIVGIC